MPGARGGAGCPAARPSVAVPSASAPSARRRGRPVAGASGIVAMLSSSPKGRQGHPGAPAASILRRPRPAAPPSCLWPVPPAAPLAPPTGRGALTRQTPLPSPATSGPKTHCQLQPPLRPLQASEGGRFWTVGRRPRSISSSLRALRCRTPHLPLLRGGDVPPRGEGPLVPRGSLGTVSPPVPPQTPRSAEGRAPDQPLRALAAPGTVPRRARPPALSLHQLHEHSAALRKGRGPGVSLFPAATASRSSSHPSPVTMLPECVIAETQTPRRTSSPNIQLSINTYSFTNKGFHLSKISI